LLSRVREASLEGYLHQDLPFEKLVDELQPERGLSHHPLFQVMFIFNNAPLPELQLPGLTMSGVDFDSGIAKFDTTLIMMDSESGLRGVWEYNLDLFDASTAARMVGHFNAILESIVADAGPPLIDEIPLLREAEKQQLLVEWNDTGRAYSRESCVHELFEAQAAIDENALAVAFKDEQLTYGELNRRANQLARHLRALGVGPEVMVGILTERCIEWVVGLLGILKAGGAYVSLDPTYPRERLAFMVADAGAPVLLTQQKFIGDIIETNVEVVCLDSGWEKIAEQSEQNLERRATAENAAYVVYTSGSTGRPKGVVTNHGSILNLASWHQSTFAVTADDRASQVARMGFDASVWELWPYLTAGASVHIIEDETRFSPSKVKDWFAAGRISIGWLPPALSEGILISEELESLSLRVLLTGSDRILLHPPPSAGFDFVNAYGPTEATVIVTYGTIAPLRKDDGAPHIGRPLANTQIYILDRRLQPSPVGVSGELYIGGDNLARGYLNHPELTAEKFVPSPFSEVPGARLYKSGDLARYLPDGKIEFIGRIDHQVKIRGFRIELGEVEATLLQHSKLEAVIVIAREDAPSEKRLAGYVVARSGETIAGGELRDFLLERLPEYMIPTAFVELPFLPLTPNGKVDRRALPAPDYVLAAEHADYVPPRTPLEESLVGMWGLLLGVERVSINQNFFELGGHSLLATQLISHVREEFEVELPLRDFFESPTVAGLAAAIERARGTQTDWQPTRIEALPRGEQSLDELLAELDQLSDEDAQSLLAVEMQPDN
jgi:amino acid adenylation domain-containing protein